MFIVAFLVAGVAYLFAIVSLGLLQGVAAHNMGQVGDLLSRTQPYRGVLTLIRIALSLWAAWAAFMWIGY